MIQLSKKFLVFSFFLLNFNIDASESIDYYNDGKLNNSQSIDAFRSVNLLKLFRDRKQLYLHEDLGLAIKGLAEYMKKSYPDIERLQIGDLSAKLGGEIPRHKSHQNGLDADLVYYRVNKMEQKEAEKEWAEYFVKSGKLSSNFHVEKNWSAFKYLVQNHSVQRIFVDGAIKKAICSYAKTKGELKSEEKTLRALRIENTVHKSHFHIRLRCPANSPSCIEQEETPSGSGC
jgi:penicillin-insensitive murein DD-endopeptidase